MMAANRVRRGGGRERVPGPSWLFGDLVAAFAGRPVPPPPSLGAVVLAMREHVRRLADWFGPRNACGRCAST